MNDRPSDVDDTRHSRRTHEGMEQARRTIRDEIMLHGLAITFRHVEAALDEIDDVPSDYDHGAAIVFRDFLTRHGR